MSVTHGRTEKGQNFRELLVAMGEVLLTPGGAIKRNVLEPACAFKRLPPPLRLSSSARAAFQRTRFLSMSSVNVTFPPRAPSDPLPPPPPSVGLCRGPWPLCADPGGLPGWGAKARTRPPGASRVDKGTQGPTSSCFSRPSPACPRGPGTQGPSQTPARAACRIRAPPTPVCTGRGGRMEAVAAPQ